MRLALLAPTTAAAFRAETDATVGGAERQLVSLAEALVARGHHVDVIVDDGESTAPASPGGATIWPRYRRDGAPLLKVIHPKISSLRGILAELKSECLIQRGAAELTGIGRIASRFQRIPFIYSVASESDLEPGGELVPHPQDRILYRLGAAAADLRVVQTRRQERQARRLFEGAVARIPSFFAPAVGQPREASGEERILWGGNLRPVKRPEWLLALADALPHRRFTVFGGSAAGHERYGARMAAELARRKNIDYLGRVSQDQLPTIYGSCSLLLNTSCTEGFPNTFLEAWGQGLDIVASVDPDGLFVDGKLGRFASTLSQLRTGIEKTLSMPRADRSHRHEKARNHLVSEHGMGTVVKRWETAMAEII